jgi:hypothetical protein
MTTRTKTSSSTPMTKRSTKGHRSPIRKHSKSHLLGAISPGYSQGYAGYYKLSDRSGPYALDSFGNYGLIAGSYSAPNGKVIPGITTLDRIFSDDFGGSALNASYWDVIDGGLPATYDLGDGSFTNAAGAIGSGVTGGITYAVSASGLAVVMGTTNNAELWFLSKKCYNGSGSGVWWQGGHLWYHRQVAGARRELNFHWPVRGRPRNRRPAGKRESCW